MSTSALAIAAILGSLVLLGLWARQFLLQQRAVARLGGGAADELDRAGADAPSGLSARADLGVSLLVVGIAAAVGFFAARLGLDASVAISAALALDAAIFAYLVRAVIRRRRALRLEAQLAEALRLTAAAMQVGMSRVDALSRAAQQVGAPLEPVLAEAVGQLRLGESAVSAFQRLSAAVPLEAFQLLSTVIAAQWHAGGSLQNTLGSVGDFLQDRVEIERRLESQSAPTRSSTLTLMAATAAIAYFSWSHDPANVERFLSSAWGNGLVATALGLQGVSLLWMWELMQPKL